MNVPRDYAIARVRRELKIANALNKLLKTHREHLNATVHSLDDDSSTTTASLQSAVAALHEASSAIDQFLDELKEDVENLAAGSAHANE